MSTYARKGESGKEEVRESVCNFVGGGPNEAYMYKRLVYVYIGKWCKKSSSYCLE